MSVPQTSARLPAPDRRLYRKPCDASMSAVNAFEARSFPEEVGCIDPLREDVLGAEAAGVGEEHRATLREVPVAEDEAANFWVDLKQPMDGLGFVPRGLGQALGCTAGGGSLPPLPRELVEWL
jgi:hypothetical protein